MTKETSVADVSKGTDVPASQSTVSSVCGDAMKALQNKARIDVKRMTATTARVVVLHLSEEPVMQPWQASFVDDDDCIVLEADEDAIGSAPGPLLPDDHTLQNLLTELRLAFLDSDEDHVTWSSHRDHVQAATVAFHGRNVKILRAAVVCTVHQSCHTATDGHSELAAALATAAALCHLG